MSQTDPHASARKDDHHSGQTAPNFDDLGRGWGVVALMGVARALGLHSVVLITCVGFFLHSSTWPRLGALGFAVAYAGLVGWLNRARKQQTEALEHAVTANAELRSALTTVQTDQARMREQLQVITNRGGVR